MSKKKTAWTGSAMRGRVLIDLRGRSTAPPFPTTGKDGPPEAGDGPPEGLPETPRGGMRIASRANPVKTNIFMYPNTCHSRMRAATATRTGVIVAATLYCRYPGFLAKT